MNIRRILSASLAALLCALPLAACSPSDQPGTEVGGDWRTTGIVRAAAELPNENGENESFLICVNEKAMNLYSDSESQELRCECRHPIPADLSDGKFSNIDFGDRNGDGRIDLTLTLEDGAVVFVWLRDAEGLSFSLSEKDSHYSAAGGN